MDCKAKVPTGLTVATKQAPMVIHVEYEVGLLYHDFVNEPSLKLSPSVYVAFDIKKVLILTLPYPTLAS